MHAMQRVETVLRKCIPATGRAATADVAGSQDTVTTRHQ